MPLGPKHQLARLHKIKTLGSKSKGIRPTTEVISDGIHHAARISPFIPEDEYLVEVGDLYGRMYRRTIQFGYDDQFQCNHEEAMRIFELAHSGGQLPHLRGSTVSTLRGKFSNSSMFEPAWAKVYRGSNLIYSFP